MALKDLKSDLSKFRMPKKDPLESKERVNVNKNLNKTPLSSMVESAPKIPRSQTTTNKEGVSPQKVNQTEKFKGETTPSKMNNSEQFLGETTPTPSNKESKFLGETNPSKMDNSENFLGETSPKPANNSEQFLGETTPTKSNLQEKFLGETDPNKFDNSEKFLGETTPKPANNSEQFLGETDAKPMSLEERFLGETTPSKMNNSEQFLGETTPNESDRSSKFLGETTPTPANNESRFLGETTPNPSDRSSKFLGETTPNESDRSSKFLGETTPNPSDRSSKFLGETTKANITQGDKDKGETTPNDFTFNPNHSDRGVTPTDINYIQDIHATGFNSKFGGVDATKFIGVNPNNTVFDNTNSLYSNIDDGKFTLGKTYEQSFNSAGRLNSGETGFGIGKGQAQRQSPSFLDEMYSKFNLKEDSFNRGLGLFRQPFILRGIQRKKISKGEPQVWGVGGFNYDEGAIRGGIVTSTVRALIDVARIGSWFASVPGILWGAKQVGLQRTNKFGKVWTPANMLTAVGSQHIGLKPDRSGLIGLDVTGKYKKAILSGYKDKLESMYKFDLPLLNKALVTVGLPFPMQTDVLGGFDSVYGIGTTFTTRFENTFIGDFIQNDYANYTEPKFTGTANPLKPLDAIKYASGVSNAYYQPDLELTTRDINKVDESDGSLKSKSQNSRFNGGLGSGNDNPGSHKLDANGDSEGKVPGSEVIKDYQTIAYGDMPDRVAGDTTFNDFRSKLSGQELERATKEDYNTKNINTRVNFGNPGKLGESENRYEWWNTDKTQGGTGGKNDRYDKINALDIDESPDTSTGGDLVHLWFQAEGSGSKVQFRGTAKGITETFSPSWEPIKYNGRADQAYKYTTFERSLSFNFQAYATSRIEMKPMWKKLQYLSTMTMPQYGGDAGYQGTLVTFRLGSLYNGKLAFIESLSYSMSDETPWEISMLASENPLGELPMGVDISIGLKILGEVRPAEGVTGIYDWSFA